MSKLRVVINAVRVPWLATEESEHGVVRPVSLEFSDEWSRRNARALSAFVDAVGDVRDAWLLFDDGKDPDPEDLVQMIEDVLDERRYRCRPIQEAVRVMSFADARGIDFSYCFVLGLVEGEFPSMPDRGFLLRKRVEWQERRREAAYPLIDLMFGSGHVSLSAFASEGSDRSPFLPCSEIIRRPLSRRWLPPHKTATQHSCGLRGANCRRNCPHSGQARRLDTVPASLWRRAMPDQLRMEVCREDRGRGGRMARRSAASAAESRNRRYWSRNWRHTSDVRFS